jgi:hypothetical protein
MVPAGIFLSGIWTIKPANVFLHWQDTKSHNPYPDIVLGDLGGLAVEAVKTERHALP